MKSRENAGRNQEQFQEELKTNTKGVPEELDEGFVEILGETLEKLSVELWENSRREYREFSRSNL